MSRGAWLMLVWAGWEVLYLVVPDDEGGVVDVGVVGVGGAISCGSR